MVYIQFINVDYYCKQTVMLTTQFLRVLSVLLCFVEMCFGGDVCREKLLQNPEKYISREKFKEVFYWRTNDHISIDDQPPSVCTKGSENWHFFTYGGMNPHTKNKERHINAEAMAKNASRLPYINKAYAFHPEDIAPLFANENKDLLSNPRCFAFLSKVYFLDYLLTEIDSVVDGDVVIYMDSDMEIVNEKGLHLLACLAKNSAKGFVPFHFPFWIEQTFTKRDTLLALEVDETDILETAQVQSGCFVLVKNNFTMQIAKEWLHYSTNPEHMTLVKSRAPNHQDFYLHKEDQSILSLLMKKHNVKSYPLPYVNYPVHYDMLAVEAGYADERVELSYFLNGWSTQRVESSVESAYRSSLKKPKIRLSRHYRDIMLHRKESFLNISCLNA